MLETKTQRNMNIVLSTVDRNAVMVQEKIDSDRFLFFVYNPETAKIEAHIKSKTEDVAFRFDTSEAMNALAGFLIDCKNSRDAAIAAAEALGMPYPKALESSIIIEKTLPEVNALAKKELEELKAKYRKGAQKVQK